MANILIETQTTNENGLAVFQNLPAGNYKYVERVAPTGYNMDPVEYDVVVTADPPTVTVTKTNTPTKTGSLIIHKHKSGDVSTDLADATFKLMKNNKLMLAESPASSAEGLITLGGIMSIEGTPQTYTVQEVTPPANYKPNLNEYDIQVVANNDAPTPQDIPNLEMGTSSLNVNLKDNNYQLLGLEGSDYDLFYVEP